MQSEGNETWALVGCKGQKKVSLGWPIHTVYVWVWVGGWVDGWTGARVCEAAGELSNASRAWRTPWDVLQLQLAGWLAGSGYAARPRAPLLFLLRKDLCYDRLPVRRPTERADWTKRFVHVWQLVRIQACRRWNSPNPSLSLSCVLYQPTGALSSVIALACAWCVERASERRRRWIGRQQAGKMLLLLLRMCKAGIGKNKKGKK